MQNWRMSESCGNTAAFAVVRAYTGRLWPWSDSLNISGHASWVACILGCTRGHGCRGIIPIPELPRSKQNHDTSDVGDGDVPAAWLPGSSGRNKGMCSSFARSARHVLVEEGARSYLTLPTISHSLLNVYLPQQHFLDDPRKFATFLYIRP